MESANTKYQTAINSLDIANTLDAAMELNDAVQGNGKKDHLVISSDAKAHINPHIEKILAHQGECLGDISENLIEGFAKEALKKKLDGLMNYTC